VSCSLRLERKYKLINPDFQSQIMTMPVNPNNQPQLAPSTSQPRPSGPAAIGSNPHLTTSTNTTPPSTGQSTPSKQQPAPRSTSAGIPSATANLVREKAEPVLNAVPDNVGDLIDDLGASGTQTPIKGGSSGGGSGKVSIWVWRFLLLFFGRAC
jgi:hypothetical protein